jgi:hypothetical protein
MKEVFSTAIRLYVELGSEYGALAIDANDWVPDMDFRDGHHLQAEGAHIFTARLIAALPLLDGLPDGDVQQPPAVAAAAALP